MLISETHYLHNMVGNTEIRKGNGMELDQLFQNDSHFRKTDADIHLFDLDVLGDAFRMRETTSVSLPLVRYATFLITHQLLSFSLSRFLLFLWRGGE